MIKKLLLSAILLAILCTASLISIVLWPSLPEPPTAPFDNLIIFGDSLSDSAPMINSRIEQHSGNNYWVKPEGNTGYYGAPITNDFSPADSSRLTWVNYIIQDREFARGGHSLLIRRQLDEQSVNHHNVSYATASAESDNTFINDKAPSPWPNIDCPMAISASSKSSCVPGLLKQIDMYLQDVNSRANPNSLIIIWSGGNDFYQNAVKLLSGSKEKLSTPISDNSHAVRRLIAAGATATNIFVIDLPDYSFVPVVISLVDGKITSPGKRRAAFMLVSLASALYNSWLKLDLVIGNRGQLPSSQLFSSERLLSDIYHDKDQLQHHLGLTQPISSSCAAAEQLPLCTGFFFYNDMHPTTVIHRYLAEQLGNYIFQTFPESSAF